MPKRYYTDYIRHCLRFYSRYPNMDKFKNDVEKSNWKACDSVIKHLSYAHREIVINMYNSNEPIGILIETITDDYNITISELWKMLNDVEYKIAKERGLL